MMDGDGFVARIAQLVRSKRKDRGSLRGELSVAIIQWTLYNLW